MGASVFVLLFFLGILISFVGGIIGVVDAFRVSTLWGLLALFVPFALLVFCIKFWRERKWARNSLITSLIGTVITFLSIPLMGGIAMLNARNTLENDLEDFSVETVPADPNAAPGEEGIVQVPAEESPELFQESMLPGLPTAAEIARAELLPSTDPNERLKEINRERSDPYAIVTVPPAVPPTPPAPISPPTGGASPTPAQPQQTPTAGGGGTASPQTTPAPGGGAPGGSTPGGIPGGGRPSQPLPELPKPTVVASQVEVSGVAAVNGASYVIVRAPGEPTSRYVRVGDRISNGTVLVKRIENRLGSSPVVVFEERGEEIALPVGANLNEPEEPTVEEPSPTTPVATLPVPNLN